MAHKTLTEAFTRLAKNISAPRLATMVDHTSDADLVEAVASIYRDRFGTRLVREFDSLEPLGFMTVTSVGSENVYFTLANGLQGFCKCL